jgi:hypothetical protein
VVEQAGVGLGHTGGGAEEYLRRERGVGIVAALIPRLGGPALWPVFLLVRRCAGAAVGEVGCSLVDVSQDFVTI